MRTKFYVGQEVYVADSGGDLTGPGVVSSVGWFKIGVLMRSLYPHTYAGRIKLYPRDRVHDRDTLEELGGIMSRQSLPR